MDAENQDKIQGVDIGETSKRVTHGQFVDDTDVIIQAKCKYVDATFTIFKTMRQASKLYGMENGVKVVYIGGNHLPQELADLQWN